MRLPCGNLTFLPVYYALNLLSSSFGLSRRTTFGSSLSSFLLSSSGRTKSTWYFDTGNWLAAWVHDLNTFDGLDVTNPDGRAKLELADVQDQLVHEVFGSGLDFYTTNAYLQLTTTTNTGAGTFEYNGYLYLDGVVGLKCKEVDVTQIVSYRVELVIFHNGFEYFTTNRKLSELKFRRVNQSTNIKGLDGEVYRISGTVENGRYETFPAGGLTVFLT